MLTAKQIQVGGATYTIGQVPAPQALDIACLVLEWRGKVAEAAGAAAVTGDVVEALRSVVGDEKAAIRVLSSYVSEQVAGLGRSQQVFARMWRDREYRDGVFKPLFEVCTRGGRPVLDGDWQTFYAGDRLGDLVKVHNAAVEHNCGGFLREFSGAANSTAAATTAPQAQDAAA